jgi:hypothetical protein
LREYLKNWLTISQVITHDTRVVIWAAVSTRSWKADAGTQTPGPFITRAST